MKLVVDLIESPSLILAVDFSTVGGGVTKKVFPYKRQRK